MFPTVGMALDSTLITYKMDGNIFLFFVGFFVYRNPTLIYKVIFTVTKIQNLVKLNSYQVSVPNTLN